MRHLFLVGVLVFGGVVCATTDPRGTCHVPLQQVATDDPNLLVKLYFPHAKPGSRGKAYVWWRGKSAAPDGAFDAAVATAAEFERMAVEIGGYTVGRKVSYLPRELPSPAPSLSEDRRARIADHYRRETALMETSAEDLRPFQKAVEGAVGRYGSVEKMFTTLGLRLELTHAKRAALRNGSSAKRGGKYIIDGEGAIYFLTEGEMETLRDTLGLKVFNHGAMGALIMAQRRSSSVSILDYGEVNLIPSRTPPQFLGDYQSHWNGGRTFDSLGYLLAD